MEVREYRPPVNSSVFLVLCVHLVMSATANFNRGLEIWFPPPRLCSSHIVKTICLTS